MKKTRMKLAYFSMLSLSAALISCGGSDEVGEIEDLLNEALLDNKEAEKEEYEPEDYVVMVTLDDKKLNFYATPDDSPLFNKKMFDKAEPFVDGVAKVGKMIDSTLLYTYIDENGEEIFDYKYQDIGHFSDDVTWAKLEGKYGYIDKEGNEIIPPIYLNNWNFNNGRVLISDREYNKYFDVNSGVKYGYMDKSGDTVIPMKYAWAKSFNTGFAPVFEKGKVFFIDTDGNKVFDKTFENAKEFRNSIAPVMSKGKIGFIDNKGEFIISPKYDDFKFMYTYNIFDFSSRESDKERSKVYQTDDGYFLVSKNKKWGIIDKDENEIVPFQFDGIGIPEDNMVEVKKVKRKKGYSTDYHVGLFDLSNNKLVLPAKYDKVSTFYGDESDWYEIGIKSNPDDYSCDLYGYFNAETGTVIEPVYYRGRAFSDGMACVQEKEDGKWGFINEDGELVIDFQFDSRSDFKDGKAFVNKNDDYTYIDKEGKKMEE